MNYTTLKLGENHISLISQSMPNDSKWQSVRNYQEKKSGIILQTSGFIYIVFKDWVTSEAIQEILSPYHLELDETLDAHAFIYFLKEGDVVRLAAHLAKDTRVKIAEPDFRQAMTECSFTLPQDDLLSKQWYLKNDGKDTIGEDHWKYKKGADARVTEAWEILHQVTGEMGSDTITIAVLDKGFELTHPDFEGKIVAPKDFSPFGEFEPFKIHIKEGGNENSAFTTADHGTACAGIALANSNGVGIVGVAPNAKFMPIVINTGGGRDLRRMFRHIMKNGGDVISCSFGNLGVQMDSLAIRAIRECATEGRNGKGCVIVFATGNDYNFLKSNELATHPNVIAVGATTSEDTFAPYTNRTTNMSVCAPGGWGHSGMITTADPGHLNRFGDFRAIGHGPTGSEASPGFIDHHHFYRFNAEGTSFACPIVAGVAALVLSANPNLTAKEVKQILQETADSVGEASDYVHGHSHKFGYGRINAANAVRRAFNMPLRLYPPSQLPSMDFVPEFSFDYGMDVKGEIKMHESFALYRFETQPHQIGKKLSLTLNVPVDHDNKQLLTIFIKHGAEPTHLFGGHDFQAQLTEDMMTQLVVDSLQPGIYFMKLMNFSMVNFSFINGGGEFTLNLTVSNHPQDTFADVGFDDNDIVRV